MEPKHTFCLSRIAIALAISLFLFACGEKTAVQRTEKKLLLITPVDMPAEQHSAILTSLNNSEIAIESQKGLERLTEDSLKSFGVLVMVGLDAGDLTARQKIDIERYVQAGNGLMGIGISANSPYTWPWLSQVLGKQEAAVEKVNDAPTLQQSYDGGRVVLLDADEADPAQMSGLLTFCLGKNAYDYARATTPRPPSWDRFTKVTLDDYDINEPMELAALPNGNVLFIERRGRMKLYEADKKASRIIATFDVCTEGNYEDGLLGLTLDPNFSDNHFIYLYYSPASCDTLAQYLSRFLLHGGDSIVMASEKVLLRVGVQRETCCHSGGSITFGPEGNLWLSTGDNTSSKESNGYSPLDERPGRAPFDAQKGSANTHDLRGKVLRIRPNQYGSYEIPDGNLFAKNGSEGRPEIYAMGCRNPFRIAIDEKTGYLYWGDVGPDVGRDGKYGPQSYDEWNQARKPGYFGWPYFQADNKPFYDRNFETDEVGDLYDPAHPINDSPYNTGSRELPPAQKAFIWYPKGRSPEFPMLGQGSNSAMSGPVYYPPASASESQVKFPAYYHGKWFIYEWARSWVQVVTFDSAQNIARIEPFLPDEKFSKPIEMEIGPDGAIYMLEYGQNYFLNNPEAKLVRIEYAEGNRLPIPAISADQPDGAAPHTVTFSATGSVDYDKTDQLTYEWLFEGNSVQATGADATFTFSENGVYHPRLRVSDSQGGSAEAEVEVRVGNAPPEIQIEYAGNTTFFFAEKAPAYAVSITDLEDEGNGGIAQPRADVSFVYVDDANDLEVLLGGNGALDQGSVKYIRGSQLIANSDCASCHSMEVHSVGPSYLEVAARYQDDPKAVEYLAGKIIAGGNGNWGEKIMAGHPQHSKEETTEMARYILSLTSAPEKGLPLTGNLRSRSQHTGGAYLLAATYTDGGGNEIAPISKREVLVLLDPTLSAEAHDFSEGVGKRRWGPDRERMISGMKGTGHIGYSEIDLAGIEALSLELVSLAGGTIEIRSGSATGKLLGSSKIPATSREAKRKIRIPLSVSQGKQDVYIVFQNKSQPEAEMMLLNWVRFEAGGGS